MGLVAPGHSNEDGAEIALNEINNTTLGLEIQCIESGRVTVELIYKDGGTVIKTDTVIITADK